MLLDRYNLNYENKNLEYFVSIINDSWEIPDNIEEDNFLIKIYNKTYNFQDFATYLEENKSSIKTKSKEDIVFSLYKDFINNNLLEIYKYNLEDENLDYKYILKEYKEGLLLFDLMQEKIWNVASSDSINIKEFYQSNKSKYSSFDDDKGEIISDYQDFLENNWITELRANNSVTIDKKVLKRIKKSLRK
jgi:peptidyl-prolyl cis-trans isomerase SurA